MGLTVPEILDTAISITPDKSVTIRAKMLIWLHEVMRDVMAQPRQWEMLKSVSASLPITDNQINLPADCGEVFNMTIVDADDNQYFLSPGNNLLSDEEVFVESQSGDSWPEGYTVSASKITFYPAATGTCILRYEPKLPATDYTDTSDAAGTTFFPVEFKNVLVQGVRAACYQYDRLPIFETAASLYDRALTLVKKQDNTKKAMPKINRHGYVRDRS